MTQHFQIAHSAYPLAAGARLNQNMCYYKPLRVNKIGSISLVSYRGLNSAGALAG
jgi:hypothetical protein